jgi:hypothetical protein
MTALPDWEGEPEDGIYLAIRQHVEKFFAYPGVVEDTEDLIQYVQHVYDDGYEDGKEDYQ